MAQRWSQTESHMQIISKIDESGTHGESDFMVMAGHTGRLAQWYRFDRYWSKALRKHDLSCYHAKKMLDHPFGADGARIIRENLMFGFCVRLDKHDYRECYRQKEGWGGKAQPDSMYGLCFRYCLSLILQESIKRVGRKNLVLHFVVEEGSPNEGAPAQILSQMKKKQITGVSEHLGLATSGKKGIPGLQAADGLASVAWHKEQNPFAEYDRIADGLIRQDFMPVYFCHINEQELTDFVNGYFAHVEHRRNFGKQKNSKEP